MEMGVFRPGGRINDQNVDEKVLILFSSGVGRERGR
jgi:hypothetical protein